MRVEDGANLTAGAGLLVGMVASDPANLIDAIAKLIVAVALLVTAFASLRKSLNTTKKDEGK